MAGGDHLEQYRAKRDFAATPEPSGGGAPSDVRQPPGSGMDGGGALRFAVQEHHATALHWDLRLERDGVLASWAVPKGIPADPRTNHLAIHTEDHPLEYLRFEGEIPAGSYGGGRMTVWDGGTYEVEKWSDREVIVVLHGARVQGRYALFATGGRRGRNWMIHRMDPPSDRGREPLPTGLEPMEAVLGDLPGAGGGAVTDDWWFEPWWPGRRLIVPFDGGRPVLGDLRVPELNALGDALASLPVVLDGVLVAVGDDGRPDRDRLEQRWGATTRATTRRGTGHVPLTYVTVDVLWLDGHTVTGLPLEERRGLLSSAVGRGPAWLVSPQQADGSALLEAAGETGFAGIVAKRAGSTYQPGLRSADWVAVRRRNPGEPSTQ